MRTTVRLEPRLMNEAKREAARRGTTLTALIERGLRLVLREGSPPARRPSTKLPSSPRRGGLLPGVDLDDSAALLDRLDGVS